MIPDKNINYKQEQKRAKEKRYTGNIVNIRGGRIVIPLKGYYADYKTGVIKCNPGKTIP